MGCQQSVPETKRPPGIGTIKGVGQTERLVSRAQRLSGKTQLVPPKLDASGNLMPEEVVRRTNSSIMTKEVTLGSEEHPVKVEYAHWTQRGYYPDDPHKENQDDFSVTLKFAGQAQDAMFAVYDGHGMFGHSCARFAKKKMPQLIAKHVRQARVKKYQAVLKAQNKLKGSKTFDPENWPLLDMEEYKTCSRKAFRDCNKAMHEDENVKDKMSGTTAISVNFHRDFVTITNVGDSRAVLGHFISSKGLQDGNEEKKEEEKVEIQDPAEEDTDTGTSKGAKQFPSNGKLLAIPLSRDQTPYRKDERERVKKFGAAIMSIDQMEGQEEMHENWGDIVLGEDVDIHGDPPRVWVEGKDYPGTAFTRSIGDYLAEDIGVTAEPEMLARELTSNDHILVIASDGVFEFLTNQEVITLCSTSESPLQACDKIVKAAYERWIIYENRTDDITVIVCFLTCERPPPTDGSKGTTEDLVELAKSMYGSKPMRKRLRAESTESLTVSQYASVEAAEALVDTQGSTEKKVKKDRFKMGHSLIEEGGPRFLEQRLEI